MSTNSSSLQLVPIESSTEVTPAVEPEADPGQAAPALTLADNPESGPGLTLVGDESPARSEPRPGLTLVGEETLDQGGSGLALTLVGEETPAQDDEESLDLEIDVAPIAAPMTDRHLIAATTEFEKGEIDQPLWDRAFTQAKGDRKAAIALYLPSRATALRVMKRETKPECKPAARPAEPAITGASLKPRGLVADRDDDPTAGDYRRARYKSYGIKAAATLCAGFVVFVFVTYVYPGSDSSSTQAFASTVPSASPSKSPARADGKDSAQLKAAEAAASRAADIQKLIGKIEEFRAADNWNLLVLYSTEWTRQEPGNAVAWSQLSQGFERLRQYAEAREAATTAVKLAPKDARYWRNLGALDVELNRPEDALKAFEVATGLDDRDVHSVVQMGILNVALARFPEAKAASNRALELSPDDSGAVCLKALIVTSQAPSRVPTAAARQPIPDDGCRNVDTPSGGAVVANNATPAKTVAVPAKR